MFFFLDVYIAFPFVWYSNLKLLLIFNYLYFCESFSVLYSYFLLFFNFFFLAFLLIWLSDSRRADAVAKEASSKVQGAKLIQQPKPVLQVAAQLASMRAAPNTTLDIF